MNFPHVVAPSSFPHRFVYSGAANGLPVTAVTTTLEAAGIAVTGSVNGTRGELVYGVVDTSSAVPAALADQLRRLDGVTMVRVIA